MGRAEDVIGQFGGDDVGKMAGAADQIVVQFRRHAKGARADALPELLDGGNGARSGMVSGSDEAKRGVEQVGVGGGKAGFFGAGHRMAAHEFGADGADQRFDFLNHGCFHAADVGHDGSLETLGRICAATFVHLQQRRAEDDEVGALIAAPLRSRVTTSAISRRLACSTLAKCRRDKGADVDAQAA